MPRSMAAPMRLPRSLTVASELLDNAVLSHSGIGHSLHPIRSGCRRVVADRPSYLARFAQGGVGTTRGGDPLRSVKAVATPPVSTAPRPPEPPPCTNRTASAGVT